MLERINWYIFILSFILGMVAVYVTGPEQQTIYVYPNQTNQRELNYKDSTGTCFAFDSANRKCPTDASKISTIPIQN